MTYKVRNIIASLNAVMVLVTSLAYGWYMEPVHAGQHEHHDTTTMAIEHHDTTAMESHHEHSEPSVENHFDDMCLCCYLSIHFLGIINEFDMVIVTPSAPCYSEKTFIPTTISLSPDIPPPKV